MTPPPNLLIDDARVQRFGCQDVAELHGLTGGNAHLLAAQGGTAAERLGQLRVAGRMRLPYWVGQLDAGHQQRLAAILSRPSPARWKRDDADPVLTPMVLQEGEDDDLRCRTPACIRSDDVLPLLIGQPWPERDPAGSARRFAARCGTEPTPIWADNFLSDTQQLDFSLLVPMIHDVLDLLPKLTRLRLLSRDWVDQRRVYALDILNALGAARLRPDAQARIEWRLYDQRAAGNLHRRELLLPRRGSAFTLPPAQIVVGQAGAGNETDAATSIASSSATLAVWKHARPVVAGTPVSAT